MTITALFFPSLADVLLFRTYGVDAPHQWCGVLNGLRYTSFSRLFIFLLLIYLLQIYYFLHINPLKNVTFPQ